MIHAVWTSLVFFLSVGCGKVFLIDDGADASAPQPNDAAPPDSRSLSDGPIPEPPVDGRAANCLLWDFTLATDRSLSLFYERAELRSYQPVDQEIVSHSGGVGIADEVLDVDEELILLLSYPHPSGSGVQGTTQSWRLVPITTAIVNYYVDGDDDWTTVRLEPDETGWLRLDAENVWSRIRPENPTVVSAVEWCRPLL